jgi:2-methylisocitrate lyase-like PEP mutase family enzyme
MNNHFTKLNADIFRDLHFQEGIFVVANAWDAGSARMLEALEYKALATTSAGLAYSLGMADGFGRITQEQTFANVSEIISATHLPVSADLENGFGDDPGICSDTIGLAIKAGLCGGSIEDATGRENDPIYPFDLAVERVKAAVAAAKKSPHTFMLTARAENLIYGRPDMNDTIKRLVAFADAGADVLFAPGLKTEKEIKTVVNAVSPIPVNVVMGLAGSNMTLQQLQDIGVKRVSLGSSLIRSAYGAFIRASKEILQSGTFNYSEQAISYNEINKIFK